MTQIRACYKCQNRKVGCHATCDEYISERKKNDEIIEKRLAEIKKLDDIYNYKRRPKRKR